MRPTSSLLAAALSAATFLTPTAAQILAYHDATGAYHNQQINSLASQGYRMISLSIYGTTSSPRYAAVWIVRSGPSFVACNGLNAADYQSFMNTQFAAGYRPKCLSATGSGSGARFAAVWEQTYAPGWTKTGMTSTQFWNERRTAADAGYDVVAVDRYGSSSDPRYIASFGPVDYGQSEHSSGGVTRFQEHFDALAEGHNRPAFVGLDSSDNFISLWRSDSVGPWVTHVNMTSSEYQQRFDQYIATMYQISVQAEGSGANARFAAVFAARDLPAPNVWTKTGTDWGPFQPFDDWARTYMEESQTRAASLAIVKDHKLVYARGYTLARDGYPITTPEDMFETASVSKPITSIAMHQHFEDSAYGVDPDDKMLDYFPWTTPAQGSMQQITLHSLLTHQGGWDRDVSPDPMLNLDKEVAAYFNVDLPITKQQLRHYMLTTQQLDFAPNTDYAYSNFGFSVLGQVLERVNPGLTYGEIVARDIFQPLGLTRPRLARSNKADRHPGEVWCHPYTPSLRYSVVDPDEPYVPGQYGGWNKENMDSHGGWVMAAPDVAKILAAFDLGASNPLMTELTASQMWTVPSGFTTVMRGWFRKIVDDGAGGTVEMYHHNGRLLGSRCFIARRADGLSFVFMTNGDRKGLGGGVQGVELNNIANAITNWPHADQFPTYGIPPFRFDEGSITASAQLCPGAATIQVSGSPEVGEQLRWDITNMAPGSPVHLGLSSSLLTVNLTPYGAPGCDLISSVFASGSTTANGAGDAAFVWYTPPTAAAIGMTFYSQAVVSDPLANPLGFTTTRRHRIQLGGWN